MKKLTIRLETEKDYKKVENLTREAFWNVNVPGASEHYYVHVLRCHKDFVAKLDFVAELDGEIVGNIMYTKAWLKDENGTTKEIVSFGPLCVAPNHQRQGIGKMLIEHSFQVARKLGYDVCVIFGSPANYASSGFVSCHKKNVRCVVENNFPTAMLVAELTPHVLDGKKWIFVPSDADECCQDEDAVAQFDKAFPHKEKGWTPTQEEFYIYSRSSVIH